MRSAYKRTLVNLLIKDYRVTERRACGVIEVSRFVFHYQSIRDGQVAWRTRINEIVVVRVWYGYKCIHALLRREGWRINHKQVYQIYCEEGLNLRSKRTKRGVSEAHWVRRQLVTSVNESWSIDLVTSSLFNGHRSPIINGSG